MPELRFDPTAPPTWGPLDRLANVWRHRGGRPPLDACDFMYMGRLWSPDHPDVHAYKHVTTRRYLVLDEAGHAYRLRGTAVRRPHEVVVALRPYRDLPSAVADALMARGGPDRHGRARAR